MWLAWQVGELSKNVVHEGASVIIQDRLALFPQLFFKNLALSD
jgi:hypothetical protein